MFLPQKMLSKLILIEIPTNYWHSTAVTVASLLDIPQTRIIGITKRIQNHQNGTTWLSPPPEALSSRQFKLGRMSFPRVVGFVVNLKTLNIKFKLLLWDLIPKHFCILKMWMHPNHHLWTFCHYFLQINFTSLRLFPDINIILISISIQYQSE